MTGLVTDGRLLVQQAQAGTVELYNADGKLLLKKQVAAGKQVIDVSGYAKGTYVVKFEQGAEKLVIR
ncbi:T9SS type A sorting domain-containing protein [Paraflavitalea speifideaquila]|uniref:T9SS type A sorting domain-containing protein n=1 Tax=Paraflavitalea speifideaquila TaxID=3076558 RepID=UPI0028E7695C|nr:T9SS type A sorting domain-containing protein [Paraflavitalea speifideiaquila]